MKKREKLTCLQAIKQKSLSTSRRRRLVMETPTRRLLIALLLCGTCGLARAGSSTGSLSITATVAQTCSVSATSTLAFGAYDPVVANASTPLTGTGSVSIKCTKGSSGITVDLDAGAHVSGTQRRQIGRAHV